MTIFRRPAGALALAGMLALGATSLETAARADDTPPTTTAGAPAAAKAKTPKECVEGMIACAKKEDFQAMCGYMAEPYRTAMPKMITGSKSQQEANAKLKKALDEKFGAGSADYIRDMPATKKMMQGNVEITDVKEDGDKATVKTHETQEGKPPKDDTIDCVKIDGFWYATPPASKGASPEMQAKIFAVMGDALAKASTDTDALTADVAGGKVATKEEAKTKYMQIQQNMGMALMAAGGMGAQPKGPPKGGSKPEGEKPPTPPAPPSGGGQ